jgi:LemA protein
MKKLLIVLGVVLAIIVIPIMVYIGIKNKLVRMDETVNETWAQVENVYQRRSDLIPNLVATVKGYAAHERETLEAVIAARNQANQIGKELGQQLLNSPQAFEKFQAAQGALASALSRLMVVVEQYPALKANENFLALQSQLEGTENRIAVERRRYNEAVRVYNTLIRQFPTSVVAANHDFKPRPFFKAEEGADKAPKVEF